MLEEDFEKEIKVVVVGNGGVGKTSMIKRFCKGVFSEDYKKTIGVDFLERTLHIKGLGEDVRLLLWDTAGQEEFDSITRTYYRGAGAAVLCFSTTDRASFEAVAEWRRKVEAECGDIAMAIVQNKVDLLEQATMTKQEAEDLANQLGLRFYRSCVKKDLNVAEVFSYLAEMAIRKEMEGQRAQSSARVAPIEKPKTPKAGTPMSPMGGGAGGGGASAAASESSREDGYRRSSSGRSGSTSGTDTLSLQRPARQRTQGKKRMRDKMGDCTIL